MTAPIHNILIIDDDRISVLLTELAIKNTKLVTSISVASNGIEALEYLKRTADLPEIILLDINMPLMDGFEFLREYSKLPPKIRDNSIIVMLTTSMLNSDEEKAKKNPYISGFFTKPPSEDLIKQIIELFESSKVAPKTE